MLQPWIMKFRMDNPPRCPICLEIIQPDQARFYRSLCVCKSCIVPILEEALNQEAAHALARTTPRQYTRHAGLLFWTPEPSFLRRVAARFQMMADHLGDGPGGVALYQHPLVNVLE